MDESVSMTRSETNHSGCDFPGPPKGTGDFYKSATPYLENTVGFSYDRVNRQEKNLVGRFLLPNDYTQRIYHDGSWPNSVSFEYKRCDESEVHYVSSPLPLEKGTFIVFSGLDAGYPMHLRFENGQGEFRAYSIFPGGSYVFSKRPDDGSLDLFSEIESDKRDCKTYIPYERKVVARTRRSTSCNKRVARKKLRRAVYKATRKWIQAERSGWAQDQVEQICPGTKAYRGTIRQGHVEGAMEIPTNCEDTWLNYIGFLPASWVIALADPATGRCRIKQFDYNNENCNGRMVLECPYWLAYNTRSLVTTPSPTPRPTQRPTPRPTSRPTPRAPPTSFPPTSSTRNPTPQPVCVPDGICYSSRDCYCGYCYGSYYKPFPLPGFLVAGSCR